MKTLRQIKQEASSIARLMEASKADSMIYDVERKRALAKANGVPPETYFMLPYEDWILTLNAGPPRPVINLSFFVNPLDTQRLRMRKNCV